jgi:rare lipoprotein A
LPCAILVPWLVLALGGCAVVKAPYEITKGTLKATYHVGRFAVGTGMVTGKAVYTVGRFTFVVAKAPLDWPLVREDIESIGSLPPKEAIKRGEVKSAPYVVRGRRYVPMSMASAKSYREVGIASWYGLETRNQPGGHMTANGEAFDPNQLTAAHKHLPLPVYVRVTNLANRRSVILRVNDRGPFVPGRIIDVSSGAAKRLGFYNEGTARVRIETVEVPSG